MAKLLTSECVVEDVILFEHTSPRVEDTDSAFFPVVDLVPSQDRIGVCLDPHASKSVAVDVIFYQEPLTGIVDENTTVFATKDLVSSDNWIAPSSMEKEVRELI